MEMINPLLISDQSNNLKRNLSYKYIMRAVHEPLTRLEFKKTFLKLTDWVCFSEHSFLRDNAMAGLEELCEMNVIVFLEIIDKSYFDEIFHKQPIHPVSVVSLTMMIISKLWKYERSHPFTFPHYPLLRHNLVMYLAQHGHDPKFIEAMLRLYTMHQVLLPQYTQDVALLGHVVIHLHMSHPSVCHCDGKLVRLLSHVWRTCQNITPCMDTLNTLYQVLSDQDISSPPACLALILESLPSTCQEQCLVYLLDHYLPSHKLLLLLTRVLAWLEVREAPNLTNSILVFLPLLGALRGNLVLNLSHTCLARMLNQVIQVDSTPCKQQLVAVALTLLYGDQQSVVLFQSVLSSLPLVTQVLEVEGLHLCREQVLEMVMHFQGLFPGILEGTTMENILQEEFLLEISPERRLQLAGWAWRYPGFIKMDRKPGQLVGLTNLGNTCYLNSVLQALFCTKMFQTRLADRTANKTQLIMHRLKRLFRCLCLSRKSYADPRAFLEVSRPPWFDVGYQQDCSEFLTFLLHSLKEEEDRIFVDEEGNHEDYKDGIKVEGQIGDHSEYAINASGGVESGGGRGDSSPPQTIVESVFSGELDTSYQCMDCMNISRGVTTFTDLHLPIPTTTSIPMPRLPNLPTISITRARAKLSVQDLINSYLEPEHLMGDNQYHCDHCLGLRNAVKTTQIKVAPKHLVITLLRFKFIASTCRKVKLLRSIDCPRIFDLPVGDGQVRYHLYCVVVHFGQSSDGGHYYTLVRDREVWYKISDEEVETVSGNWDQEERGRRDTPYMLFYQREDVI